MSAKNTFRLSSYLFGGLVIANIATISWTLFLGHIVMPVHVVASYSVYRELETNKIIDVEALAKFRDGEYADHLHLYTTQNIVDVANEVTASANIASAMLLIDLVVLVLLFRRIRVASQGT